MENFERDIQNIKKGNSICDKYIIICVSKCLQHSNVVLTSNTKHMPIS